MIKRGVLGLIIVIFSIIIGGFLFLGGLCLHKPGSVIIVITGLCLIIGCFIVRELIDWFYTIAISLSHIACGKQMKTDKEEEIK